MRSIAGNVAVLERQEQRMIRLMENSDTDSNSEPLVLLDPSAPGYDQIRDQAEFEQARLDLENEQTMLRRWVELMCDVDPALEHAILRGEAQRSDSDLSGLTDTPPLTSDNSDHHAEFERQQRELAAEIPVLYLRPLAIDKRPSSSKSGKFAVRPAGAPVTSHPFFHVDAEGERCEDPGTEIAGQFWNMTTAPNEEWRKAIIDAGIQCAMCLGLILNGEEAGHRTRQQCKECKFWLHAT